ncbi:MAG: sugar phosphate isomerase/epimerase [Gammaproteobacteria bacterium]|nr:sugar phosphate isomerase/epimerase [Gammaproteobacteria bacterium]
MKLAYSTNAYTRFELGDALSSIADLGFKGAEILCDHPHWFPGRVQASQITGIKHLIENLGLGISNLNANTANGYYGPLPSENLFEPSLSSADDTDRRWRIQYSIETIRLAYALGADCISLTSGRPGSGDTPTKGMQLFVESLKQICAAAENYGVRVGIEYEPGLLVERADEVAEVLQRVDSPQLGANLDLGHAYLSHESPEETIGLLAGRIWNVHVEDIANYKHFHLIPGEGDIPLSRYFQLLDNCGYDRYLTVELYSYPQMPEEAGRRSLAYLRELLERNPSLAPSYGLN